MKDLFIVETEDRLETIQLAAEATAICGDSPKEAPKTETPTETVPG